MNYSYRIEQRGLRADVIAAVKAAVTSNPEADQSVLDGEKSAILAAIAAIPAKFTGISVLSIGDCEPTGSTNARRVAGYTPSLDSKPFTTAPVTGVKPQIK